MAPHLVGPCGVLPPHAPGLVPGWECGHFLEEFAACCPVIYPMATCTRWGSAQGTPRIVVGVAASNGRPIVVTHATSRHTGAATYMDRTPAQ